MIERLAPDQPAALEYDLLPALVRDGRAFGFRGGRRFIDIGVPSSYAEAESFFLAASLTENLAPAS